MGLESWVHWAVVLLVVVLIFGTKKLGNIGKDLGAGIRGFKEGIKGEEDAAKKLPEKEVNPPLDGANRDRR